MKASSLIDCRYKGIKLKGYKDRRRCNKFSGYCVGEEKCSYIEKLYGKQG